MGTASSKALHQQQRRRAQVIAVAQAEKRLEAGRRSSPGAVHRSLAPGTLSPIKTTKRKSKLKPLAKRASDAMGCTGRKAAKKKASLLPRPSSAGGLAVEVGGKQFFQAGEARRREAEAAARAKAAQEDERSKSQAKLSRDFGADYEREYTCAEHDRVIEPGVSELPAPHRQPCVNDQAWLRRPTPLAAKKPQKEDENRDTAGVGPHSLAPRRLGPLAPLPDHHTSRTPRLPTHKKLPAPRGRRHQPQSNPAPTLAMESSPLAVGICDPAQQQQAGPPVPSIGWAPPEQRVAT